MATIIDVAHLAGVATSTVSRVLTGKAKISVETQQKVFAAIEELKYRPDIVARSLIRKKTDTVGLVLPRYVSHVSGFTMMIETCQSYLNSFGKSLYIIQTSDRENSHIETINALVDRGCDGILLFHNFFFEKDNLTVERLGEIIDELSIPLVVMNAALPSHPFNCVWIDHLSLTCLATNYVIDLGHKQLAYLSAPLWQETARLRLSGFQLALKKNHLSSNSLAIVETDRSFEGGYAGMMKLLERKVEFTGLCCFNDAMAIGALKAWQEYHPEHHPPVLIGIDNDPVLDYITPNIHSVSIRMDLLSEYAVRLLMMHQNDNLDQAVPSRSIIGELVIRG